MIESVFRSTRVRHRLQQSVLGLAVYEAVTSYLVDRRHPLGTVQQYVQSIEHFDRWLRRTRRPISALGEEAIARFLDDHLPRCRCPAPACTTRHQVRTSLRHLLRVLRSRGLSAPKRATEDASPAGTLVQEFADYLNDVRGTALSTSTYYRRYAREFLAVHFGHGEVDTDRVEPAAVTARAAGQPWGICGGPYSERAVCDAAPGLGDAHFSEGADGVSHCQPTPVRY